MTRRISRRALALVVAAATAGCQDPYATSRAERTTTPTETPRPTSRPGPPARRLATDVGRRSPSPRRAARSFATLWVNWDWRTAAGQQRALARLATGDLARELRANATSTRIDATLARDKPGSRGKVAAIELRADGAHATGIVVTREQTYTDGRADLGGQRDRVYRIRLSGDQKRWGVSAWEPQP